MPLCVRCASDNHASSKLCLACGAILPREAGGEQSLVDFEEERGYPVPTESFDTENLAQLHMALDDFLQGGPVEEVHHWLDHLRQCFQEFRSQGLPQLQMALEEERRLNSEGDFHHHVGYLVHRSLLLYESGFEQLETALGVVDEEGLEGGFSLLRHGNDYLCTALLMMEERKDKLEEALAACVVAEERD